MKTILFLTRASALAILALCCLTLTVRAEDDVLMSDSVHPLPVTMTARSAMTDAETAETMEFMIALKMRDTAGLQARLAKGEIIAPAEMTAKYYPLEADYKTVETWLKAHGFTITRTDPNRLGIFASGTVAQTQVALKMSFAKVTANGRSYTSASSAPSLPASVAATVIGINGLQPHLQKHTHSKIKVADKTPLVAGQAPFYPSEILKAYGGANLGVTGAGQQIGIVIDTPPKTTDLTKFWTTTGVNQSLNNVSFIQVVAGHNAAVSGEESLDTEWTSGIASGAKIRVYVTTDLSDINLDAAYQQIIADIPNTPGLNQISLSFGGNELDTLNSQMTTDAQYFMSMASAGVSVFASTGDDGSRPDASKPPQISSPSNDPNVMGVGGTSIFLSGGGTVASETAWSGSGGGVSTFFSRPTWQTGGGVPAGTFRLNPDISSAADPDTGALVYVNGGQQTIGGTSWSAPTWAGISALINEARAKANLAPVGNYGPKLYPLIGTANFRDITSGSNGNYSATTNFDLCTGIGVPNLANLITTLTGGTGLNQPTITSFTPSTGPVGTTVTINGTNFLSPMTVMFNGVTAAGVFTSTQGTFQVPAGATTGVITATTNNGTATSATSFTVTAGNVTTSPNLTPIQLTGWSDKVVVSTMMNSTLDSRLTPTDTLYLGFAVANIGSVSIPSAVSVEIDVDGTLQQMVTLASPFAANSTQTKMNVNLPPLLLGSHTVTIKLDPSNTVAETNENDNTYTKTITISPPLPNASIVTTIPTADANAQTTGQFTVTLSAVQPTDVTVNFTTGGTAVEGTDYVTLGTSVLIPANSLSAVIPVTAKLNAFAATSSKVTVTLASTTDYLATTPSSATVTVQNTPPALVFMSTPSASPNPATAGQSVTFNAAVTTLTGDTVTYTWDFADGTTLQGLSVTHTYQAPGTYDVIVTAKDGLLSTSAHVAVTVTAIPMEVTSALLRFSFNTARDSLTIKGTLPIGQGYSPLNDTVLVTIGGYQATFPLSSRGLSHGTGLSFALSGRMKFGVFTDSVLKYQLKLTNQDLFNALNPTPGFSQTESQTNVVLPVLFEFTSTAFVGSKTISYIANGKTGSGK